MKSLYNMINILHGFHTTQKPFTFFIKSRLSSFKPNIGFLVFINLVKLK